ncbi:MAG: serine hydrolase domain-containing protein, partial [Bryobacteraceae bacterium]
MTLGDCARTAVSLAAACALLAAQDSGAAGMSAARLSKIHTRMQEFVGHDQAAGIVTMVERHGQIASLDAVGYQDLATKTPMRADTIFELMSMTKSFTCAGVMMLMEEGRLSLIDPVEKFLPEFKGQKVEVCPAGAPCETVKPSRRIEIRDLMTHTSGMAGGKPREIQDLNKLTLAEAVSIYARQPLMFEPGTK